jgi:ribonuclease Z
MFAEAAELAKTAAVQELWLTHYSPSLIYPDEYMEEIRKIFPNTKPGKDRKTIVLAFDKD